MITFNDHQLSTTNFPNGERCLALPVLTGINTIVLYYESDQDLMDLMFLRKHMDQAQDTIPCIDLVLAYMPYSRMDRQNSDYIFTLKHVCDFINWLKFDRVYVVEPHSDVTCALLDRAKPVWMVEHMLPMVMEDIGFDAEQDYLVFPDAGAAKRYEKLQTTRTLIGLKVRDFKTGNILAHEFVQVGVNEDYLPVTQRKKALIVDDLCSRGGTFVAACESLDNLGFAEKHLLVAHCENNIYNGDLFDHITSVHATTSLQQVSKNDKLHLHELEELLYGCI